MATPAKQEAIAELTDRFRESGAAVLTEYRGLSVSQLSELRTSLRANGSYSIVKNTLTKLAARQAGVTAFDGEFTGPSAIAFVTGDPVEAAQCLRDFAKANPLLLIKSGVLDGKPLTAQDLATLADLGSREVQLGRLAGAMKAKLNQAVFLFAAPMSKAVRVVDALRVKAEQEGGSALPVDVPVAADAAGSGDGQA